MVAFFFSPASEMKRRKQPPRPRKKPANSVVALLTDFGERDHYVGTMKGVILSINPRARLIDISHDVTPHNIREAGYLLWASYRYFPAETVFACVVDPGVGSKRRIICLESQRYKFVAPENGLLDAVVLQEANLRSYEVVDVTRLTSKPVSTTFHGRDIFAPLAALLSLGKPVRQLGKPCELSRPSPMFYEPELGATQARILHVDHFGNLITNIPGHIISHCAVRIGGLQISRAVRSYSEASGEEPSMIVGSSGLIEVVVKEGSAARVLRADVNTPTEVENRS